MLAQIVGYQSGLSFDILKLFRKNANVNVAKMRGKIDVVQIVGKDGGDDYENETEWDDE